MGGADGQGVLRQWQWAIAPLGASLKRFTNILSHRVNLSLHTTLFTDGHRPKRMTRRRTKEGCTDSPTLGVMHLSSALQVVECRVLQENRVLQEYREQSTTALWGGGGELKVLKFCKVLKGFTVLKARKGSTFSKLLNVFRKSTASPQRCLYCSWSSSKNETHWFTYRYDLRGEWGDDDVCR